MKKYSIVLNDKLTMKVTARKLLYSNHSLKVVFEEVQKLLPVALKTNYLTVTEIK